MRRDAIAMFLVVFYVDIEFNYQVMKGTTLVELEEVKQVTPGPARLICVLVPGQTVISSLALGRNFPRN